MSLRSLLNRRITVTPFTVGAEDRYGNTARTPGTPLADVPARRDQVAAEEDVRDRDQQTTTFLYLIALRNTAGDAVSLTGRSRITDGAETLELLGQPELLYRRRRPHHWEARAQVTDG